MDEDGFIIVHHDDTPLRQDPIAPKGGVASQVLLECLDAFAKVDIIAPDASGIWHSHPNPTIIYIISGYVRVDHGPGFDRIAYAFEGDLIRMPSHWPHRPVNEMKAHSAQAIVIHLGTTKECITPLPLE